ncbi:uncharacterized protein [Rutidosis leptorrhynchoides]|uniref:uncharacterized protein n=1 Tax=Rutidosis leptorrhynchoides TaxID=125765 RepID=UPI003A992B13
MFICDPAEDFSKYGQSIQDWIGGLAYGIGVLAQKAFETYQTHLSISTYIQQGKLKGSIRLGICLKNIKIKGSQDFVFDMISKLDDDNMCQPLVFLDSLFTNLEKCLPSFKVSSGAQIDLQSLVLDFDTLKELEKHQLSSPPYGYKDAIAEIGKATRILTKYHGLKCCRVWTTRSVNGRPDFRMGTKKGTDQCYAYHINMRNIYTGDIEYSFLLTLADHVPSFKLSSGPQFDHLVLQAGSVIASVDQLSPLVKMIKCSSVSASVQFANLKTEFSQFFHPVSSKNDIDIDYRLTYYSSSQFTRPLWI